MKVLIAVHHFPPHYTGGAEWRAYRTATTLQSRGHDVRVICVECIDAGLDSGAAWKDDVYKGIVVRRLSFNLAAAPNPVHWEYDNAWIGDHLREFLRKCRPDIFHLISGYLMGAGTIRAANEAGLPTVATLTDYWFICPRATLLRSNGQLCTDAAPHDCVRCLAEEKRRYRWPAKVIPKLMDRLWTSPLASRLSRPVDLAAIERRRQVLAEALDQLDLAICPSEFLRQVYVRAGAPAHRLIHSRQGLALSGDTLASSSSDVLRIGYIGQLVEHKGIHLLIEAFKQLDPRTRPATLTIYGDPTRFPRYVRRLRKLANNHPCIRFAGMYAYNDLGYVLSELDVVVVPSIWYENSPNAVLEAFAHRVPVVASDTGGITELVHHGKNGLLFAPGDAGALADQLQWLVANPTILPALRAGIAPVKSMAQEMDELVGVYHSVVGGSTVAHASLVPTSTDSPMSRAATRNSAFISGSQAVPNESEKGGLTHRR
jgi:glycosyltransferase involved in cell wall biosynthesis